MENCVCRLCNSNGADVIYSGPIRSGGINSESVDGYSVCECYNCKFTFLYPEPAHLNDFYETEEYRKKFFNETDVESLQSRYDSEQNSRIFSIGVENLRNKVVADFGAGPGLFLDTIQGVAKKTIAIEPSKLYREYFIRKGHGHYSYGEELERTGELVDVVVSFDTVEHISDVKGFIKQIYGVLKKGGKLYLSMPNQDDVVRQLCRAEFEPFFYQVSHLNYFNKACTEYLLNFAGFKNIDVGYVHKYDISNLLQWCKYGKPGALNCSSAFDDHFQQIYIQEIIRLGVSSHIFASAVKE